MCRRVRCPLPLCRPPASREWSPSGGALGRSDRRIALDRPVRKNRRGMRISAKADYAVRAALELASGEEGKPVKGDAIAEAQGIPLKFLENILGELKHSGLVGSRRGAAGGGWVGRAPPHGVPP